MKIVSQRDPRWSKMKLGPSSLTMGTDGCTTTATSIGSQFLVNKMYLPDEVCKKLEYTKEGYILWASIKNLPGLAFEYRYYIEKHPKMHESFLEALKNPKKFCLLQIRHSHWVLLLQSVPGFYWVADPWPLPSGSRRLVSKSSISGGTVIIQK